LNLTSNIRVVLEPGDAHPYSTVVEEQHWQPEHWQERTAGGATVLKKVAEGVPETTQLGGIFYGRRDVEDNKLPTLRGVRRKLELLVSACVRVARRDEAAPPRRELRSEGHLRGRKPREVELGSD
jgi:hypothetical protein